jgi:hypothetical protein
MTGDGLADLVEVQNGSVRYWPSLGRGRFGDPMLMENAPRLDYEGGFDPARVQLVDVDGSGAADLLYLTMGTLHVYRNARGVRFLDEERIEHLPPSRDLLTAQIIDLLGDGSLCLVWTDRRMEKLRAVRLTPDGPPGQLAEVVEGPWVE